MIKLNNTGYEYSLKFDKNHIYQTTYNERNVSYFECVDDEIKTLIDNCNNITSNTIKDNDVIFFSEESTFPKLLLSRLNLSVKRTLKTDKATKIIINNNKLLNKNGNTIIPGYIIIPLDGKNYYFIEDSNLKEINLSIDLAKLYFPGEWKRVICLNGRVDKKFIDLINDYHAIITTPVQVTEYLNSKLTKLDLETKDSMISMLKANDEEHNKLAINMLGMYDLSDVLYDIYEILGKKGDIPDCIKNSVMFKYLMSLIESTPTLLIEAFEDYYWRRSEKLNILSKIFNLPISHDQKLKCFNQIKKNCGLDFNKLSNNDKKLLDARGIPCTFV